MDAHTTPETEVAAPDQPRPRRRRGWLWVALALLLAVGVGFLLVRRADEARQADESARVERPVPVADAVVAVADMPVTIDALGTVTPLATVTVQTRIDGALTRIGFREGQDVRKGDFLAEVDPRPYRIALEQAEAQLAKDQALLRNAEVDLNRYRNLVAEDSIARQQLDTQESLVRQYSAQVKLDQALVDEARLNLDYCRILSPVDGRVGLRLKDEGNYIRASDTSGIVVITQLQPITVVFTIPEDKLQLVLSRMQRSPSLPVAAYDRSGVTRIADGTLATIDNQIDATTGTIKLKASFANADERLYPNQFVNVRLLVDTLTGVTVVPSAAVQRGTSGAYVYVINADHTVAARPVTIGTAGGDRTQIRSGLTVGERIVSDGVDRLREGSKVTVPSAAAEQAPAVSPVSSGSSDPAQRQPASAGRVP